jgi:hypothetical protein
MFTHVIVIIIIIISNNHICKHCNFINFIDFIDFVTSATQEKTSYRRRRNCIETCRSTLRNRLLILIIYILIPNIYNT